MSESSVISDDYIAAKAEELLAGFAEWDPSRPVIPVSAELIAEQYLGYELDITDQGIFEDPDYLAGIFFEEKIIRINQSLMSHEGRYNFTLAHEIGHHVLHLDGTHESLCRETGNKPPLEQQADLFAASLLMPASFVRAAFAQLDEGSLPSSKPTTTDLRVLAARVVDCGGFSNVSNTAMVNRLIDLGLVSGADYQTGTPWDYLKISGTARRFLKKYVNESLLRWIASLRIKAIRRLRND